jgi:hypothetical protein
VSSNIPAFRVAAAGLAPFLPWAWQEGQCWAPESHVRVVGPSPAEIGKPATVWLLLVSSPRGGGEEEKE